MSEIGVIVDSLEAKVLILIEKLEKLEQSNIELQLKLIETQKTNEQQNKELKNIKTNYNAVKITNSLLGSNQYKKDTKLKINSLIREIDSCIAQLSD